MKVVGPVLLLGLAACASSNETAPSDASTSSAGRAAAQPWERDPFTQTSLIEIDGNPVGYLVEYQPIPEASGIERALPAGSYRIQGRDFEDIGFITPRGEVCRYAGTGSLSLGSWPLSQGVLVFFGGGTRARFTMLQPMAPRPAVKPEGGEAPPDPAAEPVEGEGGEPAAKAGYTDR